MADPSPRSHAGPAESATPASAAASIPPHRAEAAWLFITTLALAWGLLWIPMARDGFGARTPERGDPSALALKIDINAAEAHRLTLLPGIGPALAGRIVDYRRGLGRFEQIEELTAVRGIGEKTLAGLRPYAVLGTRGNAAPAVTSTTNAAEPRDPVDHDARVGTRP